MARCLELAKKGIGFTRPNPSVGAVVVFENKIIGEGYTSSYGGSHAEVNAIQSVKNEKLLKKATLYVTLEPCSHHGKTPPCSDLIITKGIKHVVIGCIDSNSLVAGKGIEKLKNAGCKVELGILEEECKHHHRRFFTFHTKKRPFIILKWAETQDGFIAPAYKDSQSPIWITNEFSRQIVHQKRAEEHAILVGFNTVLQDNPRLTTREFSGNNPIRIVVDKNLELSKKLHVFDDRSNTIVVNGKVTTRNQNIYYEKINFKNSLAQELCDLLYKREIQSVIIEGGTKTLQAFIDSGIWDEAAIFIGQKTFQSGVKSPTFKGKLIAEENIMGDVLKVYVND